MSTNRSQLNGFIEVAGQRADVIVANPNGILVGGLGFINTSRGMLTTGTPAFGGDGSLAAFRVTRGDINVSAGGINATGTDQLDLIARSVQLNDALWANQLNVVAGSNQVNYAIPGVQVIAVEGDRPTVGIDSAALGRHVRTKNYVNLYRSRCRGPHTWHDFSLYRRHHHRQLRQNKSARTNQRQRPTSVTQR
jgi:hypothetical protein